MNVQKMEETTVKIIIQKTVPVFIASQVVQDIATGWTEIHMSPVLTVLVSVRKFKE